jgi:hypothetical protein
VNASNVIVNVAFEAPMRDWSSGQIALGFEIPPIDGRIFVPAAMASAVSSSNK